MENENKEGCAMLILAFFGVLLLSLSEYLTKERGKRIESREVVQPEKVLTTDGKKVDTIYVYKLNQK